MVMVPAANFSGVAGWRWPSFVQMVPRRKTPMSALGSQRWCDAGTRAIPARVVGSSAVAGALRLALSAAASADDLLVRRLSEESTLLVLDNCEHVAAACGALVSVLLTRCPQLRVLTTSRIPLGLSGEQVFPVPPMTGSKQDSGTAGSDAVDLFVRRAHLVAPAGSVNPGDPAIAEICHRLGGLPLAIELAAGWTRLLSPSSLLAEIARGEEVLASELADLPDRHQNMTVVTGQHLAIVGLRPAAGVGRAGHLRGELHPSRSDDPRI
jgi:predicted ATPase